MTGAAVMAGHKRTVVAFNIKRRCAGQRALSTAATRLNNAVERQVAAGKLIHVVLDNYATHKHPKVTAWLARHPRWIFHLPQPRPPGSTRSRTSSRK
jgi:hypothetical protein